MAVLSRSIAITYAFFGRYGRFKTPLKRRSRKRAADRRFKLKNAVFFAARAARETRFRVQLSVLMLKDQQLRRKRPFSSHFIDKLLTTPPGLACGATLYNLARKDD